MRSISRLKKTALMGGSLCALLAAASAAYAQVSSINSAIIVPRVFNDIPGATGTYINAYPGSITLGESGVSKASGYADRDVWYFSNNGGASAYTFQDGQYFDMSFGVTMTGGTTGYDLESGILFSNPTGTFGGDCQSILQNTGGVVQFGGPSFFPFSPQDGGSSVPNYVEGSTYTMGLNYVLDPNTGLPSFQYSVNGVYATSSPGDPYFDLGGPLDTGAGSNSLGGYLQIQNDPNNPNQAGQAVFSNITITPVAVPEPASLSLLAIGSVGLLVRRRAMRSV
jgi:hypothetical protein